MQIVITIIIKATAINGFYKSSEEVNMIDKNSNYLHFFNLCYYLKTGQLKCLCLIIITTIVVINSILMAFNLLIVKFFIVIIKTIVIIFI